MKEHVFIDTDVLIDVLALRQEFLLNSSKILSLAESKLIVGYTSSICIVNCNYIMERVKIEDRKDKIKLLSEILTILPCSSKDIQDSLKSDFNDFEDGIQNAIAINSNKCKVIISRNIKDYAASKLEVLTPEQYLNRIKKKKT